MEIQLLAIHLGSVCLRSARKVLGRNRYLTRNRFICGEIDSQAGLAIVQMVHLNPAHWGRGGAIRVGRLHIVVHIVRMEQHIRWDKGIPLIINGEAGGFHGGILLHPGRPVKQGDGLYRHGSGARKLVGNPQELPLLHRGPTVQ